MQESANLMPKTLEEKRKTKKTRQTTPHKTDIILKLPVLTNGDFHEARFSPGRMTTAGNQAGIQLSGGSGMSGPP